MSVTLRRAISSGLLLASAVLILLGTVLSLAAWLAARSLAIPLASLSSGGLLLVLAGVLLRDAQVGLEVLLSALSVPLLLFGLGLLFRTLGGRSSGHLALALILLLAGAGGAIMVRALLGRHRAG